MRAFVILDPELKSYRGHFLHYDNAVTAAAKKQGYDVVALASDQCLQTLPCDFTVIPCFRDGLEYSCIGLPWTQRFEALRRLNLSIRGARFIKDLRWAERMLNIGASTRIFVPTITAGQIRPLIRWLESIPRNQQPLLMLMLRYVPSTNPFLPRCAEADDYERAFRDVASSPARDRVQLFTDSEILKQEFAALTRLPITVTPIPHTVEHDSETVTASAASAKTKSMTFLGPARWAKGFQYLPYVVRQLLPTFRPGGWSADFQAHITQEVEVECLWARAELRRLPVTLYERELSAAEYWQILSRSSLVLFPYELSYYYAQTSGVLCEALSAGKPVVVPRGTWMARQIKGTNVGQTFIPGDRVSLADAVAAAIENIEEHAAAAADLRLKWIEYHNPDSFFKSLTSPLAA